MRENYQGFVSAEMGKMGDIGILDDKMRYLKGVFE